jgi:hypothetical protein
MDLGQYDHLIHQNLLKSYNFQKVNLLSYILFRSNVKISFTIP